MRDFISLNGVLNSILNKFELPQGFGIASPYQDWGKVTSEAGNLFWESIQPRFNYTYKLSVAASALNEVLHDSPPVRCFEFDMRKTFAVEAEVLGEIKEILTDATAFHGGFYTACMEHFKKAITEGDEELRKPVNFPIHYCEQSHPTGFLKDSLLGFSLGELNRLLEGYISGNHESKIAQLLGKNTETLVDAGAGSLKDTEPKKKLTKLDKQQAAILEAIKANKFNPMAIPDGEKSGVIQLYCENNHAGLFKGSTSFDRAWKDGIGSLWQMEHHDSYARRGNN